MLGLLDLDQALEDLLNGTDFVVTLKYEELPPRIPADDQTAILRRVSELLQQDDLFEFEQMISYRQSGPSHVSLTVSGTRWAEAADVGELNAPTRESLIAVKWDSSGVRLDDYMTDVESFIADKLRDAQKQG